MGRKEITTKEDLMKVIELFENTGITYWLDGGWGVDILAGKQTRIHRDIDINFDAQHTEKLLNAFESLKCFNRWAIKLIQTGKPSNKNIVYNLFLASSDLV